MSDSDHTTDLIQRYLDGIARETEIEELGRLLASEPDAADLFVRCSRLGFLLEDRYSQQSQEEAVVRFLEDLFVSPEHDNATEERSRIESLAEQELPAVQESGDRQHRSKVVLVSRNVVLAAASSFAAAVIVGILLFVNQGNEPVIVATIAGGQEQRWADGGLAMTPAYKLKEGQLIELESGLVEIMFNSGVRVILEGPVKFTAQSFDSGYLHQGKLIAQVIDCPNGFLVETPKVTIVDLGTEFGVEVRPGEPTNVQVFQGAVEATPNRPGGKRVLLAEGLSAKFDSQGPPVIEGTEGMPSLTHRFVRAVDFAASQLGQRSGGRVPGSEPFIHYDVDFSGGTAGSYPKVASPVAGGTSTVLSAQNQAILRNGYTDAATSETIGGDGQLVVELNEPIASVRYSSAEADVLRGAGVVTVELDLLQDSLCNTNSFILFLNESHKTIAAMMLQPRGRWCLLQYTSPHEFDTKVEIRGANGPATRPGTPVHCVCQLDLEANELRVSLDGGMTFSSASIPEDSSYSRFEVRNATSWDQGSIVVGNVRIESASVRQERKEGTE